VTGGVSGIEYLLGPTGYLKGEGGIVIKSMDVGIGCAPHSVVGVPPL
jgi:hypothetical protein